MAQSNTGRRIRLLAIALSPLFAAAFPAVARAGWFYNADFKQVDARDANDFELLFRNDITGQINAGGTGPLTNPFATPARSATKNSDGNTVVHYTGSNTIAKDLSINRHFGVGGTGTKPVLLSAAWSYADAPTRRPAPAANVHFAFNPSTLSGTVSVSNESTSPITFSGVGFLVTNTEIPLDDLNRANSPPASFTAMPGLDGTLSPGSTFTATIPNISASQFITTFDSLTYANPSDLSNYNLDVGEWNEQSAIDAVPEPATLGLLCMALAGRLCSRRRRPA